MVRVWKIVSSSDQVGFELALVVAGSREDAVACVLPSLPSPIGVDVDDLGVYRGRCQEGVMYVQRSAA